jgi:hypothetical protein
VATDLENVVARRSAAISALAGLSGTSGDSPNINGGGMGTVDHTGKITSLYKEIEDCNRLITLLQGPVERAMVAR